ncbi:MAG: YoaH family protein, partial [Peptococcaceae bacterium]|nr:YoaH family protein [Peptococcaceae bacterium]
WAVERVNQLVQEGISQKDAIKQAAKEAGLPKREVYNLIVKE